MWRRILTVALAEGGGIAAARGGQPGGAGHVERDAVVLAERVAEALHGGGAPHRALDAVAALLGRLALRAPGHNVRRAPHQAVQRRAAVCSRRPRRRRRGLRRRAGRERQDDGHGDGEARHGWTGRGGRRGSNCERARWNTRRRTRGLGCGMEWQVAPRGAGGGFKGGVATRRGQRGRRDILANRSRKHRDSVDVLIAGSLVGCGLLLLLRSV